MDNSLGKEREREIYIYIYKVFLHKTDIIKKKNKLEKFDEVCKSLVNNLVVLFQYSYR